MNNFRRIRFYLITLTCSFISCVNEALIKCSHAEKMFLYNQILSFLDSEKFKDFDFRIGEKAFLHAKLKMLTSDFESAIEVS